MDSRYAGALRALLLPLLAFLLAGGVRAQAALGPSLQDALSDALVTDRLQVIVTFDGDGPLTALQRTRLASVGVAGVTMQSLPIAGVLATPAQVGQIASLPGVRSVWHNDPLEYENDGATALTGVDRLRTDPDLRTALGLPFSGKGIGVLVNDSGVDGTHPDIQYPNHVVQNVSAQTNLNSLSALLPVTYLEDNPNTDVGGGHGTHVAGIIGGTGAQSAGRFEGVAPGADIIGYGSGAALFILDTIGGFDYALTHQFEYNIRVVSNSFGSTSDIGTDFDPDHPTNVATKALADRGVVVVFSAGNSGAGENTITGNFKKAPWVVMVGAGDDLGALADFSSRGLAGNGGTVAVDGETYEWVDRPTVTAPGVDIVSTRASLGDGTPETSLPPGQAPFYTSLSGTSMACPHVSGIVALMLEADPTLDVYDVRRILETTATNMPGREIWETGAGYVNAYAAVAHVLGQPAGARATVNGFRTFDANALLVDGPSFEASVFFSPVGEPETVSFEVGEDVALVKARATVPENTVAIVLTSPSGKRYGSGITLPILGEIAAVVAPGEAGTWTYSVSGIGGVSGQDVDPLGVTNGYAAPGTIDATISLVLTGGFSGINDLAGHPARAFVEAAVLDRLADGLSATRFFPDRALRRGELAEYLVMGAGVRQPVPGDVPAFGDVAADLRPFAEAVAAQGAALKDQAGLAAGLVRLDGGAFAPAANVRREDLAYSLVAALGLHGVAADYEGDVFATFNGERIALGDVNAIAPGLRGYVQLALDAGLMNAQFAVEQGPFDLEPTITATFSPRKAVTRAEYAAAAVRLFGIYDAADPAAAPSAGAGESLLGMPALATAADEALELEGPAPNPVVGRARIAFSTPGGAARLAVYDVLGREVAVLVDGEVPAGRQTASFDAAGLAAGAYVYRLTAGDVSRTGRLTVAR
jgi:serine protease AprX